MEKNRQQGWSCVRRYAIALVAISIVVWPARLWGTSPSSPDPALQTYYNANGLLSRGINDLAIEEYRKFLSANANHEKAPLARYGLAVALFRTRAFAQAIAEIDQLTSVGDFEFAAEVQLILGQSHLQENNPAAAAEAFAKLLTAYPTHPQAADASALLTEAYHRVGDFKSSISTFQALASKWPDHLMRERAEFFAALSTLALEDFAAAAAAFEQIQKRYPNGEFNGRAGLYLAQSLHRIGQLDQAARHYRTTLERGDTELAADARLGLASLLAHQEQFDQAIDLLDRLLDESPKHRLAGAALIQRGRARFEQKQYESALDDFIRADKLDDAARDQTAYWISKCQLRLGKPDEAAQRLARAIEDHPESKLMAEMWYDLAMALERSGDSASALKALQNFTNRYSSHELAADALYGQAIIEHDQRQYAASQQTCAELIKRFPTNVIRPSVDFLAAENAFLSDEMERAAQAYDAFIKAFPKHEQLANARFRLGSALYRLEKLDEARQNLSPLIDGRQTAEPYRQALLMVGDLEYRNSKWEAAIALLGDYLSFGLEQPGADDALLKVGLSFIRLEKPQPAVDAFTRIIERFPDSVHAPQAMFERGQALMTQDDFEAAAQDFKAVLSEAGDSRFAPYAVNHLAAIAMHRQEFSQAADLYQQLLDGPIESDLKAQAMFQRGQALMAARQFAPASECFRSFIKQHSQSERVPLAHAQLAMALARLGEESESLEVIAQIERQWSKQLAPDILAPLAYEKAWCLRELDRTDEAAETYRTLIEAHPDQPITANALLELAEMYSTQKRQTDAEQLLVQLRSLISNKESSIAPEVQEQALYRLAVVSFELGRFDQSAEMFKQFISDFPKSDLLASAHVFCGESLFKINRVQQASDHFQRVVEKYPDDPAFSTSLLRLGECQAAASQFEESEKTFAAYLEQFADSELWFQAQFGLGWAVENQGRHDEAIRCYRKVIEQHNGPTAARAQFQIGECLFARKRFDEAVRELLKVDILYGYPEWSAAALYEAGRCFEQLSRPAEARAQFQLVQEKYPDTEWAKLAAQRLTATPSRSPSGG
ncbi:MAG: tetratricopeptide repeat protein [Phycisphaerales bacterium]|nr:tetratricopeptide repeat protein [Phycisphaerales bacterium]